MLKSNHRGRSYIQRIYTCSYTTLIPFIYYYNDKWEVTIQQYDDEQKEMLSATYRITEEVFDAVTIGSEFVYSNDMEPLEPEYTRERQ